MSSDKKPQPERDDTDKSLRLEREKSDSELAKTQTPIEAGSDAAIQTTRDQADQTSQEVRDKVDVKLARGSTPPGAREIVHQERAETDTRLMVERASSDKGLETRDEFLGMVSHDLRSLLEHRKDRSPLGRSGREQSGR